MTHMQQVSAMQEKIYLHLNSFLFSLLNVFVLLLLTDFNKNITSAFIDGCFILQVH